MNQREGLAEIRRELRLISGQLKAELRWGKRGPLFPNTAWTKNQHLVTDTLRKEVEAVYGRLHSLDRETINATRPELDERETQARQDVKQAVDTLIEAVSRRRNEVQS